MTEQEIRQLNYTKGGNNYVLRGNADWVAFQKQIVERLKSEYGNEFNIVIYWNEKSQTSIGYVCIPYDVVKTLMTDEHLSHKKDGSTCWNFIIKNHFLMVHANSKYAINIEPYLNQNIFHRTKNVQLSAEEGKILMVKHRRIERNRSIVNAAKSERLKIDPLLRCEVCGFSFVQTYGKIGQNFIEAHHKVPLSELFSITTTQISDFAMVCSNCHRMLHSCSPALSVEELKGLLILDDNFSH